MRSRCQWNYKFSCFELDYDLPKHKKSKICTRRKIAWEVQYLLGNIANAKLGEARELWWYRKLHYARKQAREVQINMQLTVPDPRRRGCFRLLLNRCEDMLFCKFLVRCRKRDCFLEKWSWEMVTFFQKWFLGSRNWNDRRKWCFSSCPISRPFYLQNVNCRYVSGNTTQYREELLTTIIYLLSAWIFDR